MALPEALGDAQPSTISGSTGPLPAHHAPAATISVAAKQRDHLD
jgi:hypothetical protein